MAKIIPPRSIKLHQLHDGDVFSINREGQFYIKTPKVARLLQGNAKSTEVDSNCVRLSDGAHCLFDKDAIVELYPNAEIQVNPS